MMSLPPSHGSDEAHTPSLETLGRIASFAAHDLNNLLQAILMNLEIALDSPSAAPPALEQAISAIRMAQNLTSRMQAVSSSDSACTETFDLVAALRDGYPFLRTVVPLRIAVTLDLPETRLGIRANPATLQQMLLNLILNAAEAIGEREGSIRIVVREGAAGEAWLEVEDDGCGMDEATLDNAFEPFHTTKGAGRGLGLGSVHNDTQAAGGEIFLESRVDVGTRVRIRFPRVADIHSQPAREPRMLQQAPKDRRILVVEDDPFACQALAKTLGRMGYSPFYSPSGEGALDLLRTVGGFRVALLDLSLPGSIDGFALIDSIRLQVPGILVVAMSGCGRLYALEGFTGDPPDGFLQKPFSGASLLAELRRLEPFGRRRMDEDHGSRPASIASEIDAPGGRP